MNSKSSKLGNNCEYEKVMREYNNLYGFNLGINEKTTDSKKTDLSLNTVKDRINVKKR